MRRTTIPTLATTALVLTGCGAHGGGGVVDGPRSDGRPPYTTPASCLRALDAAQTYIQNVTLERDHVTTLIQRAFRAGTNADLVIEEQILADVATATAPTGVDPARLVHEFNTAAADCRN